MNAVPSARRLMGACAGLCALLLAGTAVCEVVERDADRFVLTHVVDLETTPEDIHSAISQVSDWWNGSHTYSGDAANMTLSLQVGACFCEFMTDGTTFEHGRVMAIDPATGVTLDAALGPLNGKATRAEWRLEWSVAGRGQRLIMTYIVEGPGLGAFAGPVDRVMTDQFSRLIHLIEYGEATS